MKNQLTTILALLVLSFFGAANISAQTFTWDKSELTTLWADASAASTIKSTNGVSLQQIGTQGVVTSYFQLASSNATPVLNSTTNDAATITLSTANMQISSVKITYSSNSTTTASPYLGYNSTATDMGSATVTIGSCDLDATGVTGSTGVQKTYTPPAGTKFIIITRGKACGTTAANATTIRIYRIEVYTSYTIPIISDLNANGISATIDQTAKTITAVLPYGTSLNAISPTVTIGGTATGYTPAGAQDFTNSSVTPIIYTATDATTSTSYNVSLTVPATIPAPTVTLTSGNTTQALKAGTAITNIVYNIINASGATVTGLPTGLTGTYTSTATNIGTLTISGTVDATATPGTFNYTVNATPITGYSGSDVTLTGIFYVKSTTAKNLLYLTATGTPSANDTKLYPYLYANPNYLITLRTAASTAPVASVYDGYDVIILNEIVGGTNVEAVALKSIDKPILSLKAFTYTTGRWGWGVPDNGLSTNGTVTIKQPTHPIFNGIDVSAGTLNLLSGATGNGIQVNDVTLLTGRSIVVATAPKSTTGNPMAVAIHDVPAALRGVTNSKYIMIPIADASYPFMNNVVFTLVDNAINYLLTGTQFVAPSLEVSSFTINSVPATIDNTANSITAALPSGTDVTALQPVITLTGIGTTVSPATGIATNFTSPVNYIVTDGISSKTYATTISIVTGLTQTKIDGVYFDGQTIRNNACIDLQVYDAIGHLVASSNKDIDMGLRTKGIYIVKCNNGTFKLSLYK
jgi:hypothetical protein